MQRLNDFFTTRISIEGITNPVYFAFHMLYGDYGAEYKVRASNPQCDINMSIVNGVNGNEFKFRDTRELPEWISKDRSVQAKLSEAITNSLL